MLLFLLALGLPLLALIVSAVNSSKRFLNQEWLPVLYLLGFAGLGYWNFTSLAVTDYDADYLYLLQRTGAKQIPLGSFHKLVQQRGWHLHYLDEQQQKQELTLIPLSTGWFRPNDSSSIHGFIEAVWQHNPNLDVRHGWLA